MALPGAAVTAEQFAELRLERLEEVVATVGFVPAGLIGALGEQIYDHMAHHRQAVIKHSRGNFNSPSRAGRMIASRLFAYGRKRPNPTSLTELQGESFAAGLARPAAGRGDVPFRLDARQLRLMETGGTVNTRDQMAIPILEGANEAGPYKGQWRPAAWRALQQGRTDVVQRPGRPPLLIEEAETVNRRRGVYGVRSRIIGVLVRRRQQRPVLGFYAQAGRILPRHLPRYDRVIDLAMTEAGRAALDLQHRAITAGSEAYAGTLDQYLTADPGNHRKARQVARQAAAAARRRALATGRV